MFKKDLLIDGNYNIYQLNDLWDKKLRKGIVFPKNLIELETIKKRRQTEIYKQSSNYNYIFRELLKECAYHQVFKFMIVGDVGTLKSSLARTIVGYLEFYLRQNKKKFIFNEHHIHFDNRDLFFAIQEYISENFDNYKKGKMNYATCFIRDESRSGSGFGDYMLNQELQNISDQCRQFGINIIIIKPQDTTNIMGEFNYEYLLKCIGYDYKRNNYYCFISKKGYVEWLGHLILKKDFNEKLYESYVNYKEDYFKKTANQEISSTLNYFKILGEIQLKFHVFDRQKPLTNKDFMGYLERLNKNLTIDIKEFLKTYYKWVFENEEFRDEFLEYCLENNIKIKIRKNKLTDFMD